jgi:polyphosphate kinase 2 (PPK2 family)
VKQHTKAGTASPITDGVVKMTDYAKRTIDASALQEEIEEVQAELQQKVAKRDQLLGLLEGQNAQTKGTTLFEILQIRDLLLAVNRGNEEALEAWGFTVVVGSAAAPKRKDQAKT